MAPRVRPDTSPIVDDDGDRMIRRVRTEKVSKVIAQLIVREVAEGQLEHGTALPHEQAMAEKYGVGRASVREALRMLEMAGIVAIRQGIGGGPTVITPSGADFGQLMSMYLQLSGAHVDQLVDAIPLIEGMAAYTAAANVAAGRTASGDVDRLVAIAARPISSRDNVAFVDAGSTFHVALHTMMFNPVLELVVDAVAGLFAQRAIRSSTTFADAAHGDQVVEHHRTIAAAVAAGQPAAAMAEMVAHMHHEGQAILIRDPAVAGELIDWR